MSDLVGNPEDRFSRVAAHFAIMSSTFALIKSLFMKEYGTDVKSNIIYIQLPECLICCARNAFDKNHMEDSI